MRPERLEATVRGRVQGVGFRWHVVRQARGLGLVGWVANQPDGSVRVVAEGPRQALQALVRELRAGPSGASVSDVEVVRPPAAGDFTRFDIRSGSHAGD